MAVIHHSSKVLVLLVHILLQKAGFIHATNDWRESSPIVSSFVDQNPPQLQIPALIYGFKPMADKQELFSQSQNNRRYAYDNEYYYDYSHIGDKTKEKSKPLKIETQSGFVPSSFATLNMKPHTVTSFPDAPKPVYKKNVILEEAENTSKPKLSFNLNSRPTSKKNDDTKNYVDFKIYNKSKSPSIASEVTFKPSSGHQQFSLFPRILSDNQKLVSNKPLPQKEQNERQQKPIQKASAEPVAHHPHLKYSGVNSVQLSTIQKQKDPLQKFLEPKHRYQELSPIFDKGSRANYGKKLGADISTYATFSVQSSVSRAPPPPKSKEILQAGESKYNDDDMASGYYQFSTVKHSPHKPAIRVPYATMKHNHYLEKDINEPINTVKAKPSAVKSQPKPRNNKPVQQKPKSSWPIFGRPVLPRKKRKPPKKPKQKRKLPFNQFVPPHHDSQPAHSLPRESSFLAPINPQHKPFYPIFKKSFSSIPSSNTNTNIRQKFVSLQNSINQHHQQQNLHESQKQQPQKHHQQQNKNQRQQLQHQKQNQQQQSFSKKPASQTHNAAFQENHSSPHYSPHLSSVFNRPPSPFRFVPTVQERQSKNSHDPSFYSSAKDASYEIMSHPELKPYKDKDRIPIPPKLLRPFKVASNALFGKIIKPNSLMQKKIDKIMKQMYPYYQKPKYRYPYYDKYGNGRLLYGFGGKKLYRYKLFRPLQGYLR